MTSHEEERDDDLLVTSWYLVKGQLPHISSSLTMANKTIGGCVRTPCSDAFLQVRPLNQEPFVCWESRVRPSSSNVDHLIREATTHTSPQHHHSHPTTASTSGHARTHFPPLSFIANTIVATPPPPLPALALPYSLTLWPITTSRSLWQHRFHL